MAANSASSEAMEETDFVPPGLHTKLNKSGLDFLKSSFLHHVHEILEQGIPDGDKSINDTLRFSWSELVCPQFEEKDPVLAIAPGEGIVGSIEVEAFSIDGKWEYAYKKGFFKWSDSGTFHLAFKRLRLNIIMSIRIVEPNKQLKLFIRPGNADVEAEDVEIKMKSRGVVTQGVINLALPHIQRMWRKPAELSRKIEEAFNANLAQVVSLLPLSYPLQREVLGIAFHVGNQFQSQFDIKADYCYWELSSVIVPTAYYVDYLEREEAKGKELKGKDKNLRGSKNRYERVPRQPARPGPSVTPPENIVPPHPFSPTNFDFPRPEVPKLTHHPQWMNTEEHISYCLSEFTLNTFASSIYDLGLCETTSVEWEGLPGYLQRYIATICRRQPESVRVHTKLTKRPEISIETDDAKLKLDGLVVVKADRDKIFDVVESTPSLEEDDFANWRFYHKTRHELRLRLVPRVDKDFVAKFAFEKIDCKSVFEIVSKTSGLERSTSARESAKTTMLAFVENMIIVELLPRLYDIGEVGIPLTINEGCIFETSRIDRVPNAFVFSGFMRFKEFGKKITDDLNDDQTDKNSNMNGDQTDKNRDEDDSSSHAEDPNGAGGREAKSSF